MQRNEKGFAVIELVMVLAIVGIIAPVLTMTTTTMLANYQQADDQTIVLNQVQNAGYWICRDVQMARDVTLGDPNGFPLTLVIPVDTDSNNDISIEYSFESNKLKRRVYDSLHTLVSENLVAQYVVVADTTFDSVGAGVYELTVKVSEGDVVVERSYKVSQRLRSI